MKNVRGLRTVKDKGCLVFKGEARVGSGRGEFKQLLIICLKVDLKKSMMLRLLNFLTSVNPFNIIKNLAFARMFEMMRKYGVAYKSPCCHDVKPVLTNSNLYTLYAHECILFFGPSI